MYWLRPRPPPGKIRAYGENELYTYDVTAIDFGENESLPGNEAVTATPPCGTTEPVFKQWSVQELTFEAVGSTPAWNAFPLKIEFSHEGTSLFILDGYYDGGQLWRVRFAPTRPGSWSWQVLLNPETPFQGVGNELSGTFTCVAPSSEDVLTNPNYRGQLTASDGEHFLSYADGTPFFWGGDTVWAINTYRCGVENGAFYTYVDNALANRFTVIQLAFMRNRESRVGEIEDDQTRRIGAPQRNEQGYAFPSNVALDGKVKLDGDFSDLNAGFFQSMDERMQHLWDSGLVVAGHPMWFPKNTQGVSIQEAQEIGRYIITRYAAYNLVLSLVGEYGYAFWNSGSTPHTLVDVTPWDSVASWEAYAAYMEAHNPLGKLLTIHTGFEYPKASSSDRFHNQSWLGVNWVQTGQGQKKIHRIWNSIYADYQKTPVKPTVHVEGFYAGGSVGASLYHSRWQAYVAVLRGASGHGHGSVGLWSFHDPNDPLGEIGGGFGFLSWDEGLELPHRTEQRHFIDFFQNEVIDWWNLRPEPTLIKVDDGQTPTAPTETDLSSPLGMISDNKEICVVYVPRGNQGRIVTASPLNSSLAYKVSKYDPRQGVTSSLVTHTGSSWSVPQAHLDDGEDWIFLLRIQ